MRINKALNLINQSFLTIYYDSRVIDNQLSNVYLVDDEDEFFRLYGHSKDNVEGFNRANKCYIAPSGTPHTVIHEVLHNLSSSFVGDERPLNGLAYRNCQNYLSLLNEGLTDYLAGCISGEKERHYKLPVLFFRRIDQILNEMYGPNQILLESYICNNTYFLENFFNTFCSYKYKGRLVDWNYFINDYIWFYDENVLNEMLNNIHKNVLKNSKKSLFNRNPKTINFEVFDELNAVGIIKKAYYDLLFFNPNANEEDIKRGMSAMFNGDLQYISNKRGVRGLLELIMNKYSLVDVVRNNLDKFEGIPVNEFINDMKR